MKFRKRNKIGKKITIGSALIATAMLSYTHLYASTTATPVVIGYYSNWDTYAQPINYPFPGNAQNASNPDLLNKIARINMLDYSFLEVNSNGYVYFTDPWSDLAPSDTFCTNPPVGSPIDSTALNQGNNLTCSQVADNNNQTFASASGLGNFDKGFVNASVANKLISIGGAGHDQSWEDAMANPTNFVNSVLALVKAYNISGVDIDYEPIGGIPAVNVSAFISLVQALRTGLGPNAIITYTIPANQGTIASFGSENWSNLMQSINYVVVMGYDMHGAFDSPSLTGLHSALYPVTGDQTKFSDFSAITALNSENVKNDQIILGFPSYGRAVSGVTQDGVNQPFTQSYQGDLDTPGCSLTLGSANMCTGMIQYSTIVQAGYEPLYDYEIPPSQTSSVISGVYSNSGTMFVSYDNDPSVMVKANYVKSNSLAGMMMWELRYDTNPLNSDGSVSVTSLLNAVDGVLGIVPNTFVKLELTNNDTVDSANITLIVNGKYYQFPSLGTQGSGANDVFWCNQATQGCTNSWNLDQIGNANNVEVQIAPNGNMQMAKICSGTLNLTPGSHRIQVDYSNSNPEDMCVLN